jgi:glycosyltransferase involved in cell wall biosynthesis
MNSEKSIVLIVPVYNPTHDWVETLIERYIEFFSAIDRSILLIVVNDGSATDLTSDFEKLSTLLGSHTISIINYSKNRGKGGAIKTAVASVEADFYMFTDFDFPYTVESMKAVYNALLEKGGIIAGHRRETYYEELSGFRTKLSKGLRRLNTIILGLPTNDTQCGLKGFDSHASKVLLACKTDRFLIDLEFLLSAHRQKIIITPCDVILRPDIEFTKFNPMVLLKEVKSFAYLIWKFRIL